MKIPGFKGLCHAAPQPEWGQASGVIRMQPDVVLQPLDIEDVGAAVAWVAAEGRSLTPRAAATGMPGGNVGPDVVLDLGPQSAFSFLGDVDAESGRVVVGPGALAADIDRKARQVGWTLPALPSSAERCTIGGMVANNAAGARSFLHGAVVERVHALVVVDARGEWHRLERDGEGRDPFAAAGRSYPPAGEWPRVRKNSSGYGFDRFSRSGDGIDLLVGSEGTLGIIVEITLDLDRPPDGRSTVLVGAQSIDALLEWTRFARDQGLSACEFIGPWLNEKAKLADDPQFGEIARASDYVVILEVEEPTLARGLDAIESFSKTMDTDLVVANDSDEQREIWGLRRRASPVIAEAAFAGRRSMQFIEDSVVPPAALGRYLKGVNTLLREVGFEAALFGHAGDANVHVNPLVPVGDPDWLTRARSLLDGTASLVADLGGTLAGEHGDGRVRAPYLEKIWGADSYQAFVSLKNTLDPEGTLNPGVVVPTPDQDPLGGLLG